MHYPTTATVLLFICYCASQSQQVVAEQHHHLQKVAVEGSQVRLQCRLPMKSRRMMMDQRRPEPSAVIWLRFDMKDPSNQEVISHGDTLLTADANPRMRVSFEEETATSVLIIEPAQVQDGGVFQCQVFVEDQVVPSSPIEVVIIGVDDDGEDQNNSSVSFFYNNYFCTVVLLFTLQAILSHLS